MKNGAFPVINSTLSPEHLAVWVAEQYGFTNVVCRLLKTNMNHSYLVTADSERYVLRIYDHKHRDALQVAEEVRLLTEIKDTVSVSYPITNAKGGFVEEIDAPEGMRCVVLFSFAKGEKQRYSTTEFHFSVGAEVGRLHRATQNRTINRVEYTTEKLVHSGYGDITKYISEELEEMKFIKNSEAILAKAFSKFPLSKGVVHLDIWYDNMSIEENGAITLFDFDNVGNGWLVLDIGYYCMQLYFIETDKTVYEQKKAAFIEGYRSVTAISDEELELIPYAGLTIWIYYLGLQAQRFDSFANLFLSENYVRMFIGRVKDWLKYHDIEVHMT